MAGKHSKSIFDFRKSPYTVPKENTKFEFVKNLSLPFKITLSAFVAALVVATIFVSSFFMQGNAHNKMLEAARETFYSTDSATALRTLSADNSEIIGWLKINDTQIDGVVCQGRDDEFYINHNQLGQESEYGALFVSTNDDVARKNNDKNVVIYGNNMSDGSMFGELNQYRNLNFYKRNPTFSFYYGDKVEVYAVFGVMLISSMDNDDGKLYKPYKSYFANDEEFNNWYAETKTRSILNTGVEVENGDNVMTLVTTSSDFEGARFVVMAVQVDASDAGLLDIRSASLNPQPKYPKIWYTSRGQKYPY